MRTLILNKFLHRNGGSETYIFKLGEALEQHGHEVQYFGMEHEGRCVGNRVNAYKPTFITYREPQIERFPRFSGLSVEVSVTSGHFFFMKSLKGINCSVPAGSSL